MNKTTVYLTEELKTALAAESRRSGLPEAELIRQAIANSITRPQPQGGLFTAPPFADRVDELLVGFGDS